MKKFAVKGFKSRRLAISSISIATVASLVGVSAYFLVDYARSLAKTTFVAAYDLSLDDVFRDEPEAIVNSEWIGGEEGFVVNKGPIRVKSAYRALFDKASLIDMADWLYRDVAWGANGLSLTEMNFTAGVDNRSTGVTLGSHTAGRDGSNIFISPDAFEESNNVTGRMIDLLNERISPTLPSLVKTINDTAIEGFREYPVENNVPIDVDNFLSTNFNNPALGKGYFNLITPLMPAALGTLFSELDNDNFFATLGLNNQSSANTSPSKKLWAELLNNTYLGDGVYSNIVRKFQALNEGRYEDFFQQVLFSRMSFIMAWKLVWITTFESRLARNYLRDYLPFYVSDLNGLALDNVTPFRSISPVEKWTGNLIALRPLLPQEDALEIENILLLFRSFYETSTAYFKRETTKPLLKLITDYATHPFNLLKSARTKLNAASASDRVSLFLTGNFLTPIGTKAFPSDKFMFNEEAWQALLANNVSEREIRVSTNQVVKSFVTQAQPYLLDEKQALFSIGQYFKNTLIKTMRYTISHEYGHHETLWQTAGEYDANYQLYSVDSAAKLVTSFSKELLDRFFAIGKVSPGFKSVADNMRIANDQYSATMSPTYSAYNYYRFLQGAGQEDNQWLFEQPSILMGVPNVSRSQLLPDGSVGTRLRTWRNLGQDSFGAIGFSANGPYVVNFAPDLNVRIPRLLSSFNFNARFNFSIADLLYEYQVSKWLKEFDEADQASGNAPGSAKALFEQENQLTLPTIGAALANKWLLDNSPTVALSSSIVGELAQTLPLLLEQNYLRGNLDLVGLDYWSSQNETNRAAAELVKDLTSFIAPMYERLISQYPNLFIASSTNAPVDDYTRALIVTNDLYETTKLAVDKLAPNSAAWQNLPAGIYMDPSFETYQLYHNLLSSEQNFLDFQAGKFNVDGISNGGTIKRADADYTGDYAEFLTRSWNQFSFRPELSAYLKADGTSDAKNLLLDNFGWYDDAARFRAHGLSYYNFDLANANETFITDDGARQIMWFREMLGLHSNLDWVNNLPHDESGKVDLDALDASLDWASSLEKVYRNYRTGKFSMWGWLTPAEATRYQYIVIRSNTGGDQYIPIKTKNTSNYFYYTDLTNKNRRSMTPNFVQWAAEWFIAGDERNANLIAGEENTIYFAETLGGKAVAIARTQSGIARVIRNNDYETIIAQALATVDPKSNVIKVQMRTYGV